MTIYPQLSKDQMFTVSNWTPGIYNPEFYALESGVRSLICMDQLEAADVAALKVIAGKRGWALVGKRQRGKYRVIIARTADALEMNLDINSPEAARSFGYPDCCFDSFCRTFGEHYEKRTGKLAILEKLRASGNKWSLLNDFLYSWFRGYSLSFHHPCGYGCKESIKTNMRVLLAIKKDNPGYAHEIIRHLGMPLLVWFDKPGEAVSNYQWFRNRTTLVFDGSLKGSRIHYRDVASLSTKFRDDPAVARLKTAPFKMGNICELGESELVVFNNSKRLFSLPRNKEHEGLLLNFS